MQIQFHKQEVLLHTVMRQKDEEFFLYGFLTRKEKYFFQKMISISGIGGKTALSFISAFSTDEFTRAVNGADVVKLSSVPGIGKKTAQRIVLELTGKLEFAEAEIDDTGARLKEDLISGLVNLGYPPKGAKDSVLKTMEQDPEEGQVDRVPEGVHADAEEEVEPELEGLREAEAQEVPVEAQVAQHQMPTPVYSKLPRRQTRRPTSPMAAVQARQSARPWSQGRGPTLPSATLTGWS